MHIKDCLIQILCKGRFPLAIIDRAALRSAYEEEYADLVEPRIKLRSFVDGIRYDLDRTIQKPLICEMIIISALLEDRPLFERLVAYSFRIEWDHYSAQREDGMSHGDTGGAPTKDNIAKRLCNTGIKYLNEEVNFSNQCVRNCFNTLQSWTAKSCE
jgi:hypothetical protein